MDVINTNCQMVQMGRCLHFSDWPLGANAASKKLVFLYQESL